MTPDEVLRFARENGAKMVDLKFVDLPGTWQHFSIPLHELKEETFIEGVPFDGSSIRGFQAINESDMLVIPDAGTAFMDPFTATPTLSLTCNIAHPGPAGYKKPRKRRITCTPAGLPTQVISARRPNFTFSTRCATAPQITSSTQKLTRKRRTGTASENAAKDI
jgi:glutamine synthetase